MTRTNTCRHQHADAPEASHLFRAGWSRGEALHWALRKPWRSPLSVKAAAGGRVCGAGRAGRALSLSPIPHGSASGSLFAPRVFSYAHPRVAPVSACFVPGSDPSALSRRWPRPLRVPRPRVSQPGGARGCGQRVAEGGAAAAGAGRAGLRERRAGLRGKGEPLLRAAALAAPSAPALRDRSAGRHRGHGTGPAPLPAAPGDFGSGWRAALTDPGCPALTAL